MPHSALAENNTLLKTSSENRDRFINPACVRHQHCYIFNLRLTLHSRLHHVSNRLLTYRIAPQIESGTICMPGLAWRKLDLEWIAYGSLDFLKIGYKSGWNWHEIV
ncbi:unnamed protein product [Lathyrus oleraceus]